MIDKEALADRYRRVKQGLPDHVELVAVSKKRTVEEIKVLYDLGHRSFGENYPQELRDKHPHLPADIRWHFIGNLQTNKVKYIAPVASLVHTIDGERVLDELNKRAGAVHRRSRVLLQVHIAREETKHGLPASEAEELINNWDHSRWPFITPCGLMGMATNTMDEQQVRQEFRTLNRLFHGLEQRLVDLCGEPPILSMGMSDDASIAIEEGSTMVRIGTAIFGER